MNGSDGPTEVLCERRATLAPDLASAAAARRLLREAVAATGREEWLDAGELAISEVVTNAALHAHTEIDVVVQVRLDRVFVEVRDFNPGMPVQRDYDDEATTGRGMGLVAAVSLECGIHSLGEDGKVAWFSVGETLDAASVDPFASWDLDGDWSAEDPDAQATTIVLRGMPATLWLSARQHHDAILRELVLYLAEHGGAGVDHAGADAARALISTALVSAVEEAQASGRARPALPATHVSPLPWVPADLDLEVSVPVGSASWFVALQDTLDVAEGLAAAGELLMRPGLPEIVAVRDWACEQVLAQLSGDPPVPWPGTAQVRFETHVNDRDRPDELAWDSAWLLESDRGVVAADDANRIVAVSRPLASLIGWDPAALVGRRVVTIVPPSLREAHVAGFSRHLSTGESHVIGVPLELPVLHADGSEVPCRLVIERAPANAGRSVYLAWIDPLGSEG